MAHVPRSNRHEQTLVTVPLIPTSSCSLNALAGVHAVGAFPSQNLAQPPAGASHPGLQVRVKPGTFTVSSETSVRDWTLPSSSLPKCGKYLDLPQRIEVESRRDKSWKACSKTTLKRAQSKCSISGSRCHHCHVSFILLPKGRVIPVLFMTKLRQEVT